MKRKNKALNLLLLILLFVIGFVMGLAITDLFVSIIIDLFNFFSKL
jgi:hypothetical protein